MTAIQHTTMDDTTTMDGPPGLDRVREIEQQRAATYRLLAALYGNPADHPDRLGETPPESVDVAVEELQASLGDPKPLRLDYAQLFVGPFDLAAPPYESVYVDDETRVMTDATAAVQAQYHEAGVDISIDEPADHVAAELEFVSLLVATECEALAAGEFEAAEHYLDRQYQFLVSHLGRWVSEIADNMRDHANTAFYRLLADETQTFVGRDGHRLADRLDAIETGDDLITVLEGEETQ